MDYEEDKKNMICLEEKSSLPSIRGGIKGEVIALLKSFSYLGFKRKKDSTSPHGRLCCCRNTRCRTPLLKDERGRKVAFTLAETLIALTVLGIVAAITVPQLVRRQIEAANRAKIKKVMTVYDFFINKVATENDVKTTKALKDWGEEGGICENQRKYFKPSKLEDAGCKFKTSDGVWWNVTDVTHPVVALKEGELDNLDSKTTFKLLAHFGPNGELRVDDLQWELTQNAKNLTPEEKENLEKLYAFANNEKKGSGNGGGTTEKCKLKTGSEAEYECEGSELTWKKNALTEAQAAMTETNSNYCIWDGTECKKYDDNTSRVSSDTLYTSEVTLTQKDLNESCTGSRYSGCAVDYWNAYRKKCEANGAHVATVAELKALKNKGTISSGYYWAAEAKSSDTDGAYYFSTGDGDVYDGYVASNGLKAVCVGK